MVLFLVLMTAYAVTACRTVGPGDSGELTAAMCTWGVAHAPGYPVLILVGNLVSHVPHAGEPAFLLNLLDALFAALACVVLSAAVGRLTGRPWAGFAAGLALGTSRIFWEYALVVEVFSLNALMAALLLDLFSRYLRSPGRRGLWTLSASAAVMASALTHHLTLVLVALPVGVSFAAVSRAELRRGRLSWPELRGALGRSLLWGAAALLPLLYIPLAARRDPALDWGDVRDLQSFLHLLLRRDFGSGWLTPPGVLVRQLLDAGESASPFPLRHLGFFWADLPRSFGWAFPALLPLGFLWAWRRCRLLLLMGGLFLAALVMFFARVNAPVVPLYVGITRPFYILPHVVIALFAGLGVAWLMDRADRIRPRGSLAVLLATLAMTGGAMLVLLAGPVSMRGYTFTRDFGANLLSRMPPGAIFWSNGDLFRNSAHYQQLSLGRRADVRIVEQPMLGAAWYVEQIRRRGTARLPEGMTVSSEDPRTRSRAWLDANTHDAAGAHPLVAVEFLDDDWKAAYRLLPMGLWSSVVPRSARVPLSEWANGYSENVRHWDVESLGRSYAASGWETSEGVWYTYSLANLRALRDIAATLEPAVAMRQDVAALAVAERWPATRRADYLAYQAEFWRSFPSESLVTLGAARDSLFARARRLAGDALALDPANLQALETTAALMSGVPRYRDPLAEAGIRQRIVELRPGDLAELEPYFHLVDAIMRDPATRRDEIREHAEAVRLRYVRILDLCLRVWRHPSLAALRQRWANPLPIP